MAEPKDLVHVVPPGAEAARQGDAEQVGGEQPDTPKLGRWYWVKQNPREEGEEAPAPKLACVTDTGSNYVELTYMDASERYRSTTRLHDDIFWDRCEFVEDAGALLRGNAEKCKRELDGLMEEVKLLSSKLGVASSLSLGTGDSSVAITLAQAAPAGEYKTALVKAKDETLPALFKAIEEKATEYGRWMKAELIPMRAEAEALKPAIARVEDRIFNVELYAGLCETVKKIKDGAPAGLTEPVHLFQRRLYMDEECLANYQAGGMEFKDLHAFERWLCRKENLERVMPFPRTVVAFQVRHKEKERETLGFREFVRMLEDRDLDKLTFLYIRNGQRVYRLKTSIDFGEKLFPDTDHPVLAPGEGLLYAKLSSFGDGRRIIGQAEYEAKVAAEEAAQAEYERRQAEEKKKPKGERHHIFGPHFDDASYNYEAFTKDNVHYDDIAAFIRREMERHNRVVLVLQGLLDRSEALHPHPAWRLFESGGFAEGLCLHRDSDRVLVAGDKPDFEAYRAEKNASLAVGSVVVGQQEAWLLYEGRREAARRDRDYRWARTEARPTRWQPEGDPGPGRFARALRLDKAGHVHFAWTKERKGDGPPVLRKYACKTGRVFNVDAYEPGDYKKFFSDPRTREEYLRWAPFLLAAEDYKAGKCAPALPLAKAPKTAKAPERTGEAGRLRMLRSWLGKAVRTLRPITTMGNTRYEKGLLWRVTDFSRGAFTIVGIHEDGSAEEREEVSPGHWRARAVSGVSHRDFAVEERVPSDPAYEYKAQRRKRLGHVDDEEESNADAE